MNQIETTRRAMYSLLAELKKSPAGAGGEGLLYEFEHAMEDHWEALRKEIAVLNSHWRTVDAQAATLLCELDEARADRSKYRQWMRSAVRQNRAERQNVKAYRETQDELVAEINSLRQQVHFKDTMLVTGVIPTAGLDGWGDNPIFDEMMAAMVPAQQISDDSERNGTTAPCNPFIVPQSAPQEPKQ